MSMAAPRAAGAARGVGRRRAPEIFHVAPSPAALRHRGAEGYAALGEARERDRDGGDAARDVEVGGGGGDDGDGGE